MQVHFNVDDDLAKDFEIILLLDKKMKNKSKSEFLRDQIQRYVKKNKKLLPIQAN